MTKKQKTIFIITRQGVVLEAFLSMNSLMNDACIKSLCDVDIQDVKNQLRSDRKASFYTYGDPSLYTITQLVVNQ